MQCVIETTGKVGQIFSLSILEQDYRLIHFNRFAFGMLPVCHKFRRHILDINKAYSEALKSNLITDDAA